MTTRPLDSNTTEAQQRAEDLKADAQADAVRSDTTRGKVLPPDSPVAVPNMPAPQPAETEIPVRENVKDDSSSWADTVDGGTRKTSVRTSLNNG